MEASEYDIAVLRKLQEVDRAVASATKEFEELPHRQAILDVRAKKEDVLKKKVQVQDMLDAAELKLADIVEEDERLDKKQAETQAAIQEVKGDYRAVTAYSRDLEGVLKRREKLSLELTRAEEEISKINPVMKQVMQALSSLEEKESELIASFQKTAAELRSVIAQGQEARKELAEQPAASIMQAYEQARERCGGVALAELKENSCSACRSSFDFGRVTTLRKQAPLATCPTCRRLLIIEE